MNVVHLHLLLNHLPVIGTLGAVLLLALALLRRSVELTKVSLGLFVLLALVGGVVFLTGEPAEEAVEHLPGVSETLMESHEEVALLASALLGGFGIFALGVLIAFRRHAAGIPRGFATLALLLALVPTAAMGYTAYLGGQIRRPEIRPGAVAAAAAEQPTTGFEAGEREDVAAAQEHLHATREAGMTATTTQIRIPEAMRIEHAELHEALVEATRAPGRVGEAAREVARVLHPHFVREEQIALPPLGLLEELARGVVTPEMAAVLPLTDSLAAELPQMLEEHRAIRAALENLAAVARAESQPEYARLAEKIMLHAQTEEQVTYLAAILVGEYVRMRLSRRE